MENNTKKNGNNEELKENQTKIEKQQKKDLSIKSRQGNDELSHTPSFLPSASTETIIWLPIATCAEIGGVQDKTIRRAIKSRAVKYKIVRDRYLIEFKSLIIFLHTTKKLRNKFNQFGLGQYIRNWR